MGVSCTVGAENDTAFFGSGIDTVPTACFRCRRMGYIDGMMDVADRIAAVADNKALSPIWNLGE